MQKSRLGVSVGFIGAALYLSGLFSGYLITILLAGYVLLFEENPWLKRTAVKAVVLMMAFSFIYGLIGLIPGLIGFVDNIFNLFDETFTLSVVSQLINIVESVLGLVETVLFLMLTTKALSQGTVRIPPIDSLISKHMA